MKSNRLIFCLAAIISIPVSATGIDASINNAIQPLTDLLSGFIFYEVKIFEASFAFSSNTGFGVARIFSLTFLVARTSCL